ncbi:Protein eiger, partial [Frankliniella fusca]
VGNNSSEELCLAPHMNLQTRQNDRTKYCMDFQRLWYEPALKLLYLTPPLFLTVTHLSRLRQLRPSLLSAVKIHLNRSAVGRFVIPLFVVSWLCMLLILFLVHNTLAYQIESQKVEVANLRHTIDTLSEEVLSLRNSMESSNLHFGNEAESSDQHLIDISKRGQKEGTQKITSLTVLNETGSLLRKKRDISEESKELKNLGSTGRKIRVNGSGRSITQSHTHRRKNIHQAQSLRKCRKCIRANNTKYSDFQAIHLRGAHPENVIESGHVGPWFVDSKAVVDSKLTSSFQLREDGQSIEIKSSGLYFIYAQVYYLTSHAMNSFNIKLVPKDSDSPINLAFCSSATVADKSTSEISCYTAAMHTFQAGDRLHVQQREKHRRLIMRPGHSFLGLIKLG